MSAARAIFSLVMLVFFIGLTIWAYQRHLDAQENLRVAQHEYDVERPTQHRHRKNSRTW